MRHWLWRLTHLSEWMAARRYQRMVRMTPERLARIRAYSGGPTALPRCA